MAQNVTTTSDTRLCKRVIFEHTRTVKSVFLVPIDAKENELEFKFNDGHFTQLKYTSPEEAEEYSDPEDAGFYMPRVSREYNDKEHRPYNLWCVTEEVDQDVAKLDDKIFARAGWGAPPASVLKDEVADDLAKTEKKSKTIPKVGEKRVRNKSTS